MLIRTWASLVLALVQTANLKAERATSDMGLRSTELRCEYLHTPLSIEEPRPRLTWIVDSDRRDERASAYRILVASSIDRLARGQGDMWDSGIVKTSNTALVEYAGKPLAARQECYWKVMSWDRDGRPGPWSDAAKWEMGLLAPSDWHALWIEASPRRVVAEVVKATYETTDGKIRKDVTKAVADGLAAGGKFVANNASLGGDPAVNSHKRLVVDYRRDGVTLHTEIAENSQVVLPGGKIPYLRRTFELSGEVARARLYSTALGVYELSLNGKRVGDAELAPGWTDYRKRVRYQAYDVTALLAKGKNAIGAIVGPGWFCGRAGLFHAREFYGTTPALLVQLEITYKDGRIERVCSDAMWNRHDGPLLAADIMDGDAYIAANEIENWSSPALDDSSWDVVTTREERRNLQADVDRPVRVVQLLAARSISEPAPGHWVFDLGQNMVGVVRLKTRAAAGTVITIRHAEMLNPDGTIYTQNLRGAAATDVYVARGGENEWQPAFTFHGFRYVELTGLDAAPSQGDVEGVVLSSDLEPVGRFACSDPRLNQLQSNILWGLRGNYLSIPTDCPQRDERMGWMADTQVFTPTATFNADVAPFMTKWLVDVDDAQHEGGAYSDVSPVMKGLNYGTPAWADAGTFVPWSVYQMTGDTRLLARHIDAMAKWVDWCTKHSTNLIRDKDRGNDYGDWLSINADTPKDLIGTAYFAQSAGIVSEAYRVLGNTEEARRYARLRENVRDAFQAKYVGPETTIFGDTQCAYVLALKFDLLPSDQRGTALRRLIDDIASKGGHLSTGFVGVANLLPVLSHEGRADVAYQLLTQDSFPSWLFSVKHGATTIWERWNGWTPETGPHPDWTMNSFNHYSLGSCGEWFYSGIAGIEPDPAHPGFAHFTVRPHIGGGLTHAEATYRSIRGPVESSWRIEGDRLTVRVRVPTNTTATIVLPAHTKNEIKESGHDAEHAEGVRSLTLQDNEARLEVGSGVYEFTMPSPVSK